MNLDWKSH